MKTNNSSDAKTLPGVFASIIHIISRWQLHFSIRQRDSHFTPASGPHCTFSSFVVKGRIPQSETWLICANRNISRQRPGQKSGNVRSGQVRSGPKILSHPPTSRAERLPTQTKLISTQPSNLNTVTHPDIAAVLKTSITDSSVGGPVNAYFKIPQRDISSAFLFKRETRFGWFGSWFSFILRSRVKLKPI